MISSMKSVGFFLNAFAFLELMPQHICYYDGKPNWEFCDPVDFCNNPNVRYEPYWEDSETIYNFIMQFNLEC